jgi:hypothetical protein
LYFFCITVGGIYMSEGKGSSRSAELIIYE